ncbi:MAG: FHA domain-containing protein, partial [Chloroflexota bacterium]|nr:FHA domain-containing protein [Chloroflexota bacterium]
MDFGAITITDTVGGSRTAALNRATVRIGRAPDNDVVLDDAQVDLQHAEILSDPSGCMVFDLSSGKTLLNGAALTENPQLLASGDVLTVGSAQIAVRLGAQPTNDPLLQSLLGAPPTADQDLLAHLLAPLPPAPTSPRPPDRTPRRGPPKTQPLPVPISGTPPPALSTTLPLADPAPAVEVAQSLLFLKLIPAELTLDTGATAILRAQIENQAEIVTSVSLTVLGIPAEWVKLPDTILPLYTNTRQEIEFTITPLRAPSSLAGTYDVTVIVQSKDRATDQASVHLQLTVLPYTQFKAGLEPKRLSRWFLATYTLTIANNGNQAQDFKLEGRDDEELMRFRFSPLSPVLVRAGEARQVRTRVRLSASKLIGKPQTYPFNVTVSPSDPVVAPARLDAELVQSPPLPPWALAAILVALVVACLAFTLTRAIPFAIGLFTKTPTPIAGLPTAGGVGEAPTPPLPGA